MYLTSTERRLDPVEEADRARLLANRMQFTRVKDLVKDCTVECDPLPGTKIARDKAFVEQWYATEPPPSEMLSDWVIRFVLNREALAEREFSVTQLAMCLRQSFSSAEQRYLYVVSSDDNDYQENDGGIVLLRVFQHVLDKVDVKIPSRDTMADPTVLDKCTAEEWAERTYHTFASHVAQFALKLYVGGIENVTKVSARQVSTVVYDRHTGKQRKNYREWVLDTDGSNMLGVMPLAGVDGRRVLSNNPVEVALVLGVEVARQVLLNEMRAVMSFYGLYVNYRHLSLLCDFMTHFGSVRAISRHTLNKRKTGPLMRCTFEEPVDTLCEAGIYSELDRLDSVSQCVMLGKVMPYGTGFCTVLADPVALEMMKPPKQPNFDKSYLDQIVVSNPFEQENDEEKAFTASGEPISAQKQQTAFQNISNPFADNSDEIKLENDVLVGEKQTIDGNLKSRISLHNPFAVDLPLLADVVVERNNNEKEQTEEREEKRRRIGENLLSNNKAIYIPSSPKRLVEKVAKAQEDVIKNVSTNCITSSNYITSTNAITSTIYIPSSPRR